MDDYYYYCLKGGGNDEKNVSVPLMQIGDRARGCGEAQSVGVHYLHYLLLLHAWMHSAISSGAVIFGLSKWKRR